MFVNACTALLCRLVLELFTCLLMQHDRHVSFWWNVHRLHVGDMSLFEDVFFSVVP